MRKQETVVVPEEEILFQKQFIQQVKEVHYGKTMRYHICTFGCQMNENDSERLSGMLEEMGYIETEKVSESDLVIFNTCCVRENAELKFYGHLGALKQLKKIKSNMVIALCGCMMQQDEVVEHIKKSHKHVDLIFGTHNLYKFPELICNALNTDNTIIDIWESTGSIAENMPILRKDGVKAWVTVMYGCNNFCSYCIVPYVRGRERSRSIQDIIKEVEMLAEMGYKEVTLLGQNVNSYGKDLRSGTDFSKLLKTLNKVDGIERIRFLTSHPKDISDDLIDCINSCKKVCNHLHLPIQSGSSRILDVMNRKYTKENYLELIKKVKDKNPEIGLSTDVIVGYPGETDQDFEHTLDVLEKVRFDSVYSFLYSKRTGTPAAKDANQISDKEKKIRFDKLINIQNRISKEINDELLGTTQEVLVEGMSKNNPQIFTGRTSTNKIVNFNGDEAYKGKLVKIKITSVQTWSLDGEIELY